MTMNDESIQITLKVIRIFDALQIRYLIGGSLASTLHGLSRTTLDSDMLTDIQLHHVPLLVQQLQDEFYISMDAIFDAIQHHSSFNLIHLESMFKVDIFVAKDRHFEQSQLDNRQSYTITTDPEEAAYVASAEDIILAKLEWYRLGGEMSDRQWQDILGVIQIQGDRLDIEYLRATAIDLNVQDLLEKALNSQN